MQYKTIVTEKKTSNQLVQMIDGERLWLLKRYQGSEAEKHRDCEKKRLALWRQQGYLVPEVFDFGLSSEQQPYLVLQWLEGHSLTEYLKCKGVAIEEKVIKLRTIIQSFYNRQQYCQQENRYEFIHHDPNTGNIIINNNDIYYLDFEAEVLSANYDLIDALAIELAKFIRWSVRDVGRKYIDQIIQLTVEIYKPDSLILERIMSRVFDRDFQFIHRWKDRNKKKNKPEEVTKYDLADRFRYFLDAV